MMKKIKFVGVVPPLAFESLWYPKRLMLLFDELAIDLNSNLSGYENYILKKAKDEIDWLSSQNLITTLSGLIAQNMPIDEPIKKVSHEGAFLLPSDIQKDFVRLAESASLAELGLKGLRYTASELRKLKGVDAVAVCSPEKEDDIDAPVTRSSVLRISLSEFPMPDDSVPWESVLDFKNNTNAIEQLQSLKVWMNRICKSGLKEYELKDELLEMIYSYEREMKISKMKYKKGTYEVILTTTADVLENLVKIKPSTAIKSFFKCREQKIKLLEEERKFAGREIAYIVSAKRKFN